MKSSKKEKEEEDGRMEPSMDGDCEQRKTQAAVELRFRRRGGTAGLWFLLAMTTTMRRRNPPLQTGVDQPDFEHSQVLEFCVGERDGRRTAGRMRRRSVHDFRDSSHVASLGVSYQYCPCSFRRVGSCGRNQDEKPAVTEDRQTDVTSATPAAK